MARSGDHPKRMMEAHKLVQAGYYESVTLRYRHIVTFYRMPWLFDLPQLFYQCGAATPFALLSFALLDAGVMDVSLRMRLGGGHLENIFELPTHLTSICEFYLSLPIGVKQTFVSAEIGHTNGDEDEENPESVGHAYWLTTMITLVMEDDVERSLPNILDNLKDLAIKATGHYEHDIRFVSALASDRGVSKSLRNQVLNKC